MTSPEVIVVGFDSAWTDNPKKPGEICAAHFRGADCVSFEPPRLASFADARAFIKSLIASGVREGDIVLFGHSLGTGVAVQMAGEFHVRGLILLAPYLSIAKMAQIRFPLFPAEYLAIDRYENFRKIGDLHVPVLIASGGKDTVVPPSQGKQLFALANEPKQFVFIPEAGHSDIFQSAFLGSSLTWLGQHAGP